MVGMLMIQWEHFFFLLKQIKKIEANCNIEVPTINGNEIYTVVWKINRFELFLISFLFGLEV